MSDTTPDISTCRRIMNSSSESRDIISNSIIFDIKIYNRVIVNYLMSKCRAVYQYNNYPLYYIRSGMSMNRSVYEKMDIHTHNTLDKSWIFRDIYREEINKEINLKLDPTSSILTDYKFIPNSRVLLDVKRAITLADSLVYSNKRWGYSCNNCSFTHPRYPFEYIKFLEIYPLINYATYEFIINNCLKI